MTDVYLPLAHLIQIYKRTKDDLAFSKAFLQREQIPTFIIGILVVCRWKSTTSRLLQVLLSCITDATVEW